MVKGLKSGSRFLAVRVKKTTGRSISSARWLQRQLNDPYVHEAQKVGYRSRAAFKLMQLDDQYHFLKPGQKVIDLGAAPGGWTQIAVERGCKVTAVDILDMPPIEGAEFIQMDFSLADAAEKLQKRVGSKVQVVLSDMAPNTTGHINTDHLRIMALADMSYEFAHLMLAPNGTFLVKLRQGGAQQELLMKLKRDFSQVRHVKPPASRPDSSELYLLALGFRGT
ncbi:MAG TPA: RlmE family RNA methyltransferase [Alphaproteobacteria bacterium]|nr:RlmE family RNA methyltransferase [Alphaproteobacteria bacterium]